MDCPVNKKPVPINVVDYEDLFIGLEGLEETNIEKFVSSCCRCALSIEPLSKVCCGCCGKPMNGNGTPILWQHKPDQIHCLKY